MATRARHWILTIPLADFSPGPIPSVVKYLRGQLERGAGGYEHWQIYCVIDTAVRKSAMVKLFGQRGHYEPTRSDAARDYCWKEDTRVEGTQFEYGSLPFKRSEKTDWATVLCHTKTGEFESIPPDIYIRYYGNIRRIWSSVVQPLAVERRCFVFWGRSGSGKSRRAWEEAGELCYAKDPSTKWWCGYETQKNVIVDECNFINIVRGQIGISHLLRWLDRYPVRVETKGGSVPLLADSFWITSNLSPEQWYPEIDLETLNALKRRLNITHFL